MIITELMAIAKGFPEVNYRMEPKSFMSLVKHHNCQCQFVLSSEKSNFAYFSYSYIWQHYFFCCVTTNDFLCHSHNSFVLVFIYFYLEWSFFGILHIFAFDTDQWTALWLIQLQD